MERTEGEGQFSWPTLIDGSVDLPVPFLSISHMRCTLNTYFFYQGLKMTSASMASAMENLLPAVTFLLAASFGLEKVKLSSLRSLAKVIGTAICVGGAISMAIYKGPKIRNVELQTLYSTLHSGSEQWMIGFTFLAACTCCGSLWLILQVPICNKYLDPLSLAAWMSILSSLQSVVLTYFLESNLQAWKITSLFEFLSIVYSGIFASGITFYLQSWVISIKGPVYSAMFNPIQIVIATIFGFLLLHEELYIGSLIGAAATVSGLYIVLWGKAKDIDAKTETNPTDSTSAIQRDAQSMGGEGGIKDPLLDKRLNDIQCRLAN